MYYTQAVKEVVSQLGVNAETGLSSREIEKRREQYGPNSLQVAEVSLFRKLLEPFIDVFMLILVLALILSAVQGNWIEVVAIAAIIAIDAIIYYIQRFSTDRILKSLQRSTLQTVSVRRDSTEQAVDVSELVPGDIVILREGDRIPADGRILTESGLLTNESMLTGESEAIAKDAKALSGEKKVYEQRNMVFSGSFVVTGTGEFIVTATGNDTEYGHIASLASNLHEKSPIERKMNKLIVQIAVIVGILAAIAFLVQLIRGVELLMALEFILAMVVSAVPEGLPIANSIILALCAKRMARQNALVKELKAIESIGIVTTIASDKTGTLTENRLELREAWSLELSKKSFQDIIARSCLLESSQIEERLALDPLDVAMLSHLTAVKFPLAGLAPLRSYAFDQNLKLSGNLYQAPGEDPVLYLKGAPETILARASLDSDRRSAAEAKLAEFASRGFKVIALAHTVYPHVLGELHRLDKKRKFQFDGFVAVADTVRPAAVGAIKQAARMGVKTKMVTGDHAGTAFAIGRELGLAHEASEVLDCSKLGHISDDDLVERVKTATIFARVTPEDKYRILSAIKTSEICAMTGDGVNDVPALVGAHVGIAMGDSPSIVQDAGDIVLLDNNFKNIIQAIRESRTVLANIRRMLGYLLATNAGEALSVIGSLILFGGHLLSPLQILWINLVTDSLMVIPIGLEPPEASLLRGKPEPKDAPILSDWLLRRMALVAVIMAGGTMLTYHLGLQLFGNPEQANTLAFTTLVVMQWSNAFSARGIHESAWQRLKVRHNVFYLALFAEIFLQALALWTPFGEVLGVAPVPWPALALTVILSFIVPLIASEAQKKWQVKRR